MHIRKNLVFNNKTAYLNYILGKKMTPLQNQPDSLCIRSSSLINYTSLTNIQVLTTKVKTEHEQFLNQILDFIVKITCIISYHVINLCITGLLPILNYIGSYTL